MLMSFLSKFFSKKVQRDNNYTPSVAFVMAAYNEAKLINNRLQSYQNLDYPKELLSFYIGSDGSTDGTDEIIQKFQQYDKSIHLSRYNRVGKTRIVYDMASKAETDVIIFTDADVIMPPESLRIITSYLADKSVGGVVTNILYSDNADNIGNIGEKKFLQLETRLRHNEANFKTTVAPTGPCLAVKRGSYKPMTDYRYSDDLHLIISIPENGLRVCFAHDAKVYEINKRSLESEFRRRKRIGEQAMATFFGYESTKYPWRSWVGFQMWSHRVLRNTSAIAALLMLLGAWGVIFFTLQLTFSNSLSNIFTDNFSAISTENLVFYLAGVFGLIVLTGVWIAYIFHKRNIKIPVLHYLLFFGAMVFALTIGAIRSIRSGGLAAWNTPRTEA